MEQLCVTCDLVAAHRLHPSHWELHQVIHEVRQHVGRVRTVLEIGTHRGDSLRVWRAVFDPDLLIGVQDTDETHTDTVHELDVRLVQGRSQDPSTFARVCEVLDQECGLQARPLDLLYVDGDHTYPSVRKDWELYSPLVREGGIVVLHDAVIEDNPTVEVYLLYRELRWERRSKLIYDGRGTGAAVFYL